MKEIILTQGKVAIVDDKDYDAIKDYPWYAIKSGNSKDIYYAVRPDPLHRGRQIRMHRQIMSVDGSIRIDHKNINGLDNRRINLRLASPMENTHNTRPHKHTSSFKGVFRQAKLKKWRAQIVSNGSKWGLGSFNSEKEAAIAYNTAAQKYYGEFAFLNTIEV